MRDQLEFRMLYFILSSIQVSHSFFCLILFIDVVEKRTLFMVDRKAKNNESNVQSSNFNSKYNPVAKFILNKQSFKKQHLSAIKGNFRYSTNESMAK